MLIYLTGTKKKEKETIQFYVRELSNVFLTEVGQPYK